MGHKPLSIRRVEIPVFFASQNSGNPMVESGNPMVSMAVLSTPARALLLLTLGMLTACSPSLSPLYRDYRVNKAGAPETRAGLEAALQEAGWTLAPADAPNVIATETRTFNNWGIYKVQASLEVAPIGDQYVRVFVHPYRKFFTGGRSKIPFMKGSLRRAILPDLNRSLEAHGLVMLDSAMER